MKEEIKESDGCKKCGSPGYAGCMCKQQDEKLPTSDREQELRLALVENARKNVDKAVLLDVYLDTNNDVSFEEFLKTYNLDEDELPEKIRNKFQDVINDWQEYKEGHSRVYEILRDKAEELFGDQTDQSIGKAFLKGRGENLEPSGEITVEARGAFLVVYCSDPKDYYKIYGKGGENSLASFHRPWLTTLEYSDRSLAPAILLIKNSKDGHGSKGSVAHERQHFINSRFMIEEIKQNKTSFEYAEGCIKDEILCQIKDGKKESDEIKESLRKNYSYFFEDDSMDDQERSRLYYELNKATDALVEIDKYFPTETSRALLVFHLIEIPLSRFSDTVSLLREYESKTHSTNGIFEVPGREQEFVLPPLDDDEV